MGAEEGYAPTKVESTAIEKTRALCIMGEDWDFTPCEDATLLLSSGRKRARKGIFSNQSLDRKIPSLGIAFSKDNIVEFGKECFSLGQLASLRVGPQLLGIAFGHIEQNSPDCPLLIEEDAGISLNRILDKVEPIPILANMPTDEYRNPLMCPLDASKDVRTKILFDIMSQLLNAHTAGLRHRDLTTSNVCVRRFGNSAAEVKATLIDFELGTSSPCGSPYAKKSLYNVLFKDIPADKEAALIEPNALELDLAYLAALMFELNEQSTILERNPDKATRRKFVQYAAQSTPFFRYSKAQDTILVRPLNATADLAPLAEKLGLVPVTPEGLAEALNLRELLDEGKSLPEKITDEIACDICRLAKQTFHREFLDSEDIAIVKSSKYMAYYRHIRAIMLRSFELYKERRKQIGEPIEYERFTEQNSDYQYSSFDQARHAFKKANALGYEIIPFLESNTDERIGELDKTQIELLARMEHSRWCAERKANGWTYGEKKSIRNKISPNLVSFDSLNEAVKAYDYDTAKDLIPILESAGLALVRRTGRAIS